MNFCYTHSNFNFYFANERIIRESKRSGLSLYELQQQTSSRKNGVSKVSKYFREPQCLQSPWTSQRNLQFDWMIYRRELRGGASLFLITNDRAALLSATGRVVPVVKSGDKSDVSGAGCHESDKVPESHCIAHHRRRRGFVK